MSACSGVATKTWVGRRTWVRQTSLPQALISPWISIPFSHNFGNPKKWIELRKPFKSRNFSGDVPPKFAPRGASPCPAATPVPTGKKWRDILLGTADDDADWLLGGANAEHTD